MTTAKEVLDLIDGVLSNPSDSTEAKLLWDVLAGLRGPDIREANKATSTVHVRARAFPRTARALGFENTIADIVPHVPYKEPEFETDSWHFAGHVVSAMRALDKIGRDPA